VVHGRAGGRGWYRLRQRAAGEQQRADSCGDPLRN